MDLNTLSNKGQRDLKTPIIIAFVFILVLGT